MVVWRRWPAPVALRRCQQPLRFQSILGQHVRDHLIDANARQSLARYVGYCAADLQKLIVFGLLCILVGAIHPASPSKQDFCLLQVRQFLFIALIFAFTAHARSIHTLVIRARSLAGHGTPSSPPRGSWRRASTPTVKGCDGWPAGPAPLGDAITVFGHERARPPCPRPFRP